MTTDPQVITATTATKKAGRPKGTTAAAITLRLPLTKQESNILAMLDKQVKWSKLFRILYKAAMGGQTVTNGNGIQHITQPDLDVVKYLVDQRFGKASTRDTTTDSGSEAMKKLARIEQYILPRNSAVTAEGNIVESDEAV